MSHFLDRLIRQTPAAESYPAAPTGMCLYVIGDVHGRLDCLRRAQAAVDEHRGRLHGTRAIEIYLGDYIDRGPQSAQVIENLIQRETALGAGNTIFIKGNHEIVMERFCFIEADFELWRRLGGIETLMSYGINPDALREGGDKLEAQVLAKLPREHADFVARTVPYATFPGYCFVHAGVDPDLSLNKQALDTLAWIREPFLESEKNFGFIVVHGHTPVPQPDFRRNRINIDTGAYATNRLTVLCIDEHGPRVLKQP